MLTFQADGSKCTTFEFDPRAGSNVGRVVLARNMAQKLKTLRFPGIIKFIDSTEVGGPKSTL